MKRSFTLFIVVCPLAVAMACSSSPTTSDGGTDAANDVAQQNDSSNDSSMSNDTSSDSPANDASDASNGMVTLTIKNYLAWCTVTVNGGTANTMATQTYQLAPNSSVTAQGDTKNAGSFYWGYWGNVGPDGGLSAGGQDTSKSIAFTITSDLTLEACCPDNGQPLTQCTF
jgi:hypothetical protein